MFAKNVSSKISGVDFSICTGSYFKMNSAEMDLILLDANLNLSFNDIN